ncbi:DNA-binding SAP [Penicillium canariense]|uniref:DNA-binding SAP n=1 Tax=Penicillium canariense TaxID=189055 RepID=A0A9W9IG24_9EURO|nr:DNA-binding SAP [Penicillium canariense]KAJ5177023.1 DNA-binding SAP [Penicillium canariense]
MADYSSWKVADLKAELKTRGIPQTGLRLKQQFIDKLAEEDAKAQTEDATAAPVEEVLETDAQPEAAPEIPSRTEELQHELQQPEEPQTHVAQEQPLPEPQTNTGEVHDEEKTTEVKDTHQEGQGAGTARALISEKGAEQAAPSEVIAVAAERVEQAPGDAGEHAPLETAATTEIAPTSAPQTSEANTELSTPLPLEEALEDKRKRKRRSQSPVPTSEAIAQKKARAKEESPQSTLRDDIPAGAAIKDFAQEGNKEPAVPAKQDARFRGLFAAEAVPPQPSSPVKDVTMDDANMEPALHPATCSLYIDGLMRPLQPNGLRNHLISLASTPGETSAPDLVKEFYLDPIKTHCFVSFGDIAAASRVRSALHGTVWPNERNRKNLWADFIPDEHVQEWIRTEEAARDRSGPPVRFEVQYESNDGRTTAILAEAGSNSRSGAAKPREPGFNRTPPLGPRGSVAQADRRPSNAPPAPPSRPGQGFKPLDDLFESTTTKPKLYYLRVPRQVADKRLDQFDELIRKGQVPRRGGDEMRRITFEDEDYFVDGGPEYGPRALNRRGGGRGGGRGRGRGGDRRW